MLPPTPTPSPQNILNENRMFTNTMLSVKITVVPSGKMYGTTHANITQVNIDNIATHKVNTDNIATHKNPKNKLNTQSKVTPAAQD